MRKNPFAFGHLLLAADALVDGAAEVTLINADELAATVNQTYAPTTSVVNGKNPAPILHEVLEGRTKAGAYYCHHFTCEAPVASAEQLKARLTQRPT
jgi:uncharacterized protein YyaL (SSP411 family)